MMENTIKETTAVVFNTLEASNPPLHQFGPLCFSRGSEGYDSVKPWLIKNLFPQESFGVIFGKSGSYKSFLAIDICCSIVTGKAWNDYKVQKGAVIYVAAEGATGVKRRVKAWEDANGNMTADNLFVLGHSLYLDEAETKLGLIHAINEIEQKNNVKVQLVVLDTLSRCFSGDENTSRDMSNFVRGCDFVKAAVNTSIMCIHHSGKDESKGSRGSSALLAACDFEFQVRRNGTEKLITFVNNKQKDAEEAPNMKIEFETVELDIVCDENKPITSLVPTKITQYQSSNDTEESNQLIDILATSVDKSCTRRELRDHFHQKNGAKPSNPERKQLSRILKDLISSGAIAVNKVSQGTSPNDVIYIVN